MLKYNIIGYYTLNAHVTFHLHYF